eukprot:scaffold31044_cov33-Phaeocystis_antarctica.AAC.3
MRASWKVALSSSCDCCLRWSRSSSYDTRQSAKAGLTPCSPGSGVPAQRLPSSMQPSPLGSPS